MTQILLIKDLYVDVGNTSIVNGLNLEIKSGETHAIMGPNGSGKSTLAKTIAGHPDYKIRSGVITYMDQNLNDLSIEERSNLGIFLGFQYPIEIPGLSNTAFLKAAINAKRKHNDLDELSASDFLIDLKEKSRMVDIEQSFLSRGVNEGFSGGEKKRNEILQMLMLEPVLSILDETDSGLDIDSMKVVASGVNAFRNDDTASLIITHYERLLNYITPDYVHVFHNGAIIKTGDIQLAKDLEERGYEWLINP
ncbi:MAG: Fe-S cluster assembly ATPase SufC [Gammaproteobacteria bacterium]|mgnify:FL=1|nr:MAG: Fe-S cluster assembly ATPase SufC [Gammaproteobacteria bacterium]